MPRLKLNHQFRARSHNDTLHGDCWVMTVISTISDRLNDCRELENECKAAGITPERATTSKKGGEGTSYGLPAIEASASDSQCPRIGTRFKGSGEEGGGIHCAIDGHVAIGNGNPGQAVTQGVESSHRELKLQFDLVRAHYAQRKACEGISGWVSRVTRYSIIHHKDRSEHETGKHEHSQRCEWGRSCQVLHTDISSMQDRKGVVEQKSCTTLTLTPGGCTTLQSQRFRHHHGEMTRVKGNQKKGERGLHSHAPKPQTYLT